MNMRTAASIAALGLLTLAVSSGALADNSHHRQTIRISNVEQLYAAVNDPANAGALLKLARGTYMLSVIDPAGVPRPNAGRLELQTDMGLEGVEGHRYAAEIVASDLPASSFPANGPVAGPNAAVRLGRGHNSLEWLYVRDAAAGQANIDSGLQPLDAGTAYLRVAHVASSGSTRGMNILNFGAATSGQTIEAQLVDNDFFDNTFSLSEGVRMGNFQGATGSTVNVLMISNRSWGQKQGRLIVNNRAQNSTINVWSFDNEFFDSGAGTNVFGGLSSNNTRADGNTVNLVSVRDEYVANTGETEFDHGGLVVAATEDISAEGGGSGNTVNIKLWHVRTLYNNEADLTGIGARSLSLATAPLSQNNSVSIEIFGGLTGDRGHDKTQAVEHLSDNLPAGPSYGNWVSVVSH
jgi:hypothetical protein